MNKKQLDLLDQMIQTYSDDHRKFEVLEKCFSGRSVKLSEYRDLLGEVINNLEVLKEK